MLTPAMRASSTSDPDVIMPNAVSTQVFVPPFLYRLPLFDATTTGLTLLGVMTVGACAKSGFAAAAAATPAAAEVWTNSRRLSLRAIVSRLLLRTGLYWRVAPVSIGSKDRIHGS